MIDRRQLLISVGSRAGLAPLRSRAQEPRGRNRMSGRSSAVTKIAK
jgi:hypothetical protein